jgi:hypothetical protein
MINTHFSINDPEFSKCQHIDQEVYNYDFIFRKLISYTEIREELKKYVVFLSPTHDGMYLT